MGRVLTVQTNPNIAKFIEDYLQPYTPTKAHLFTIIIEMLYDESRQLMRSQDDYIFEEIVVNVINKYKESYKVLPIDDVTIKELSRICLIELPNVLETLTENNLLYEVFCINDLTERITIFQTLD